MWALNRQQFRARSGRSHREVMKRFLRRFKVYHAIGDRLRAFEKSLKESIDPFLLGRIIPRMPRYGRLAPEYQGKMKSLYTQYKSEVSAEDMAISSELSVFPLFFCHAVRPTTILDLGSGLSSAVFRAYASAIVPAPMIWSIDDSPIWLEKTRSFLDVNRLPFGNLLTWESFINLKSDDRPEGFDLVLHDLGNMECRREALQRVLRFVNKRGFLVLDDMQFPGYAGYVTSLLREQNFRYYSLKKLTLDSFGRYAILVHC